MTKFDTIKKYPNIFGSEPFDSQTTLIYFGFQVNENWLNILEEMSFKINLELEKDQNKNIDFKIIEIKEKSGELKIYHRNSTDEILEIIKDAELKCSITCSNCGNLKHRGVFVFNSESFNFCEACKNIKKESILKIK